MVETVEMACVLVLLRGGPNAHASPYSKVLGFVIPGDRADELWVWYGDVKFHYFGKSTKCTGGVLFDGVCQYEFAAVGYLVVASVSRGPGSRETGDNDGSLEGK
jgi:hypothetical protein